MTASTHDTPSPHDASEPRPDTAVPSHVLPAEWLPHDATLLSWPHNPDNWPDHRLDRVEAVYRSLLRELTVSDRVVLLAGPRDAPAWHRAGEAITASGADPDRILMLPIATDDVWARDYGPITVHQGGDPSHPAMLDWQFNSWGGKYPPFESDNAVPTLLAEQFGLPRLPVDMVLEGGAIDTDGAGTLLTTEAVQLNPNRNPTLTREGIERRFGEFLGIRHVIWLGDGLEGDDTDGHVDDLTRFVTPDTVVTAICDDPRNVNYAALRENHERLLSARTADGRPLRVVTLPMPDGRADGPARDGSEVLPASYANFYFSNGRLLVPLYDPATDGLALEILQDLLPGFDVVGIPCRDLVWGQGSIHCVTHQLYGVDW